MQVQNINSTQYSNNISFDSLKVVRKGLYKQMPRYAKDVIGALEKNPKAVEFCEKYNADVIIYSAKPDINSCVSSLYIFYKNPALSNFRKFLNNLFGKNEPITIHSWGTCDLKDSNDILVESVLPENHGTSGRNGLLDVKIKEAEEKLQKVQKNIKTKI